jgi:hypothetical protein
MSGGHGGRLLGALIVAETALTLVLLAGAGLMIQNFLRLRSLPLGFDARGLLTLELMPSSTAYPSGAARSELIRRIVEEARTVPGVSAAITTVNPLGGGTWGAPVISEVAAARDPNAIFNVNYRLTTPGLFETMGIGLMRGRPFTDQDREGSQPVAIVSAQMAHRFWPERDAVRQRLRIARPGTPWVTIVGVAGDVSDSHDPGVPIETWSAMRAASRLVGGGTIPDGAHERRSADVRVADRTGNLARRQDARAVWCVSDGPYLRGVDPPRAARRRVHACVRCVRPRAGGARCMRRDGVQRGAEDGGDRNRIALGGQRATSCRLSCAGA